MAYEALNSLAKKLDRILDQQTSSCLSHSDVERRRFDCSFLRNSCFSPNGEKRCSTCTALQKKIEIKSLHENAVFLSSFLEDFPEEAANLEARLIHAAKQVKYTIDCQTFDCYDTVPNENDPKWEQILQELEKSIEEIDSLLQEAKWIKSTSKSLALKPRLKSIAKETMVGLGEGLIEIKSRLCGEPSSLLEIIPIVGMGGIGKTTLAKHTYQDPSTSHHFDVRAWVSISQDFSAKGVLLSLLSSFDPSDEEEYQQMDMESLLVYGHRYLKKRRYLIVMDDVWDDLRNAFPEDCNGSRIIITTRNLGVASYFDTSNKPHMMQLLSKEQSWRLLEEKVFGQEKCPAELESIGEHIAEKCKGLPLAIVVIAGLLSSLERKQNSWEKIARDISEAINASSDDQFSSILSLSYMHLPPDLRPCFLYTSYFPEDYGINVSKLIQLWIAEGFVKPDGSKDMYELGYECLEDLIRRNLIMTEKKSYDGKIKAVKVHDVLRDLCIRKMQDENSLHFTNDWGFLQGIDDWEHFRLRKVLNATTVALTSFPDGISELNHLTYLALAFDTTDKSLRLEVPEWFSKLQNLQTLVLRPFDYFSFTAILPVSIWRMPQLRHIILHNGILPDPCTDDCQEALPLRNLHTLSRIESFTCSDRILELLPNLKKLGINYFASDLDKTGWSRYGLNNLVCMARLEKLSIYVNNSYKNVDAAENLAFPMTLKRLTLSGCVITWEKMSIIGSLPNLEVLKLKRIISQGTLWETAEGEFCEIKVLLIDTTDLHQWITESSHLPRLEHLTLYECSRLQEIPWDIGEISTLQSIEVDIRNLSVVRSAKAIQREHQSFGNDLEVRILKSRSWKRNSFF